MKQYLLSVHSVEGDPVAEDFDEAALQAVYAQVDALNDEIRAAGAWVFAGGLFPPDTATVVREQNGEIVVTDGPFSEAKEQLGGFWIINANDLDEALAWARKATVACMGPVEVRPFQDEVDVDVEVEVEG